MASEFDHAAAGSFIDGKRTGLSGYMFREMAGKVSWLANQISRVAAKLNPVRAQHRVGDLRIADEVRADVLRHLF